jgi:hypothetical protein
MSSETRTFNFTNRRRIAHEDVSIEVSDSRLGENLSFKARLNLSEYAFDDADHVYLEAHRNTEWERFDLGPISALATESAFSMAEFASADGVQFRLKVVSAASTASNHRLILGQAENLRPILRGARESLLPLVPDEDLRHELWRLHLDPDTGPTVHISVSLVPDRHAFARSNEFLTIAMPCIIRSALTWAVSEKEFDWKGQWESHKRALWVRFSMELLGQSELPRFLEDPRNDDEEEQLAWIDEAVVRFCGQLDVGKLTAIWLKSE